MFNNVEVMDIKESHVQFLTDKEFVELNRQAFNEEIKKIPTLLAENLKNFSVNASFCVSCGSLLVSLKDS
jgi:hypothetical protein